MNVRIFPSRLSDSSVLTIPGSKSHTVRALCAGLFAEGESTVLNPLEAEDTRSCLNFCRAMGARIETKTDRWIIQSRREDFFSQTSPLRIDIGNSGTGLYFGAALAALGRREVFFTGDRQIRKRPVRALLRALSDLGASGDAPETPPFRIKGPLRGGSVSLACPTSQYLSALLFAAPLIDTEEGTRITPTLLNEKPYADMTLDWLDSLNIDYEREGYESFFLPGRQSWKGFVRRISGDFSGAAFLLCGALINKKSLTLKGLDPRDTQGDKELLPLLEQSGASVEWLPPETHAPPQVSTQRSKHTPMSPEKTAEPKTGFMNFTEQDLRIRGEGVRLGDIDLNAMPDLLPVLAVTACFGEGRTRLLNVAQARIKETDRIALTAQELSKMGARIREKPDGLEIDGRGRLNGCSSLEGHGDHRIIMSLAMAALAAEEPSCLSGIDAVSVTFPRFFSLLEEWGAKLEFFS